MDFDPATAGGFDHICDGPQLQRTARSDDSPRHRWPLAKHRNSAAVYADHWRSFFLHVHAANAHLPYLVEIRSAFIAMIEAEDRGRFLNSVEETDAMFWSILCRACAGNSPKSEGSERPLLVISSDHGQSFGEHGYHRMAAVTAEQTQVPLLIHHPLLPAARFLVFPVTLRPCPPCSICWE